MNATRALAEPFVAVINHRQRQIGRPVYPVSAVQQVVPSGEGTLWLVLQPPADLYHTGVYQVWWDGRTWTVEGPPTGFRRDPSAKE